MYSWDDEEDGDWVAPTVPNPKCDEVSGCGKWEKVSGLFISSATLY